jgi:cytidylate kinase
VIVAIDGPSASGKGTLARGLAKALGFAYLDSGSLYRAVAAKLLAAGFDPDDAAAAEQVARAISADDLERPDLRGEAVAQAASRVAALPPVRAALLAFQRDFAKAPPGGAEGAVLDGRDIGTVVCPEAEVKLFVTASAEERALRRSKELIEKGESGIYARVLKEMRERDGRDTARSHAPLVAAADAVEIDTTDKDADAVLAIALAVVAEKRKSFQRD